MVSRALRRAALTLLVLGCNGIAHADWAAMAALQSIGARVPALAVDLDDNKPIQELHADVRLTPASLTKLAVAAGTLRVWPASQMFETRLLATAPPIDGIIKGDL